MPNPACPDPDHHAYLERTALRYRIRVKCEACGQKIVPSKLPGARPATTGERIGTAAAYGISTLLIGGFVALLVIVVIIVVLAVNGGGTSHTSGARARLLQHHCSRGRGGDFLVDAQLANDGPTANVQATVYVLLKGYKRPVTPDLSFESSPWQFDKEIPGHESDFFEGAVPANPGDVMRGCGVKLGAGAPDGMAYEGDGYGNGP